MDYKYESEWIKITIKDCPDNVVGDSSLHDSLNNVLESISMTADLLGTFEERGIETKGQAKAHVFLIATALGMKQSIEMIRSSKNKNTYDPLDN